MDLDFCLHVVVTVDYMPVGVLSLFVATVELEVGLIGGDGGFRLGLFLSSIHH